MTLSSPSGMRFDNVAATDLDPSEYAEAANSAFPGSPRTVEEVSWKWRANGYGEPIISIARDERGRIVGAASFGAFRVHHKGLADAARMSYDTFVIPRARGQRVFGRLLHTATSIWRATPVSFNFPNEASTAGFAASGWRGVQHAQQFSTLITPMGIRPWRRTVVGSPDLQGASSTFAGVLGIGAVTSIPSAEHVAWRLDHPGQETHLVEVRAVSVLASIGVRKGVRELRVLESWSQQSVHDTLDAIRSAARILRCPLATLPLSHPRPEVVTALRRNGWIERPSRAHLHVWEGSVTAYLSDPWQISGSFFHTW